MVVVGEKKPKIRAEAHRFNPISTLRELNQAPDVTFLEPSLPRLNFWLLREKLVISVPTQLAIPPDYLLA